MQTHERYDEILEKIADYVLEEIDFNNNAITTAKYCLLDALGCAILALNFEQCTKLLGPIVPNANLPGGSRVPGLKYELDPVQAAFNIGTMIRWLDFNDTWLAAEWGHPSDNLGSILAVADYLGRKGAKITMQEVLFAMIKAYEIQGIMALKNAFNRVGLDHVILVKLASAAVVSKLLGGDRDQILRTLSLVMIDGQSLRTYRHYPNTGSRKSWAAGDATARAVFLALLAQRGEMGYPSCLTVPQWGFYDAVFEGNKFELAMPFKSYVMENILFKIAYPAEFHAQTAVECAVKLHPLWQAKQHNIVKIEIITHEAAMRIINKQGPLKNPADRDHCIQYMVAVALLTGGLRAENYEDSFANNSQIDKIRAMIYIAENKQFNKDYFDLTKRAIANGIRFVYNDNTTSDWVVIEYPLGHANRRAEALPLLLEKFKQNTKSYFSAKKIDTLMNLIVNNNSFLEYSVVDFMALLTE